MIRRRRLTRTIEKNKTNNEIEGKNYTKIKQRTNKNKK
jgi:hypothetical protein